MSSPSPATVRPLESETGSGFGEIDQILMSDKGSTTTTGTLWLGR